MWSFKALAAAAFMLMLTGCGFRPLYAPPQEDVSGQSIYAFDVFETVLIENIHNREGQYFRNRLIQLLQPHGQRGVPRYRLTVSLNESTSNLAVQRSAIATRANLTVTGSFDLQMIDKPTTSYAGTVRSSSGYNIFQSEFQTLMAEGGARERALDDLAHQLRIRLAALLTTSGSTPTKP